MATSSHGPKKPIAEYFVWNASPHSTPASSAVPRLRRSPARSSSTRLLNASDSIGTSSIRLTPGSTAGPSASIASSQSACAGTTRRSSSSRLQQNRKCTGRYQAFQPTVEPPSAPPNSSTAGAQ